METAAYRWLESIGGTPVDIFNFFIGIVAIGMIGWAIKAVAAEVKSNRLAGEAEVKQFNERHHKASRLLEDKMREEFSIKAALLDNKIAGLGAKYNRLDGLNIGIAATLRERLGSEVIKTSADGDGDYTANRDTQ